MSHDTSTQVEEWRDIPGYEGRYRVSSQGKVKRLPRQITRSDGRQWAVREKLMKASLNHNGYLRVNLKNSGGSKSFFVHRLVAEAFIGPPLDRMDVCHGDGNKINNHSSNLRYGSRGENQLDQVRHGTHCESRKTHCPRGHKLAEWNNTPASMRRNARSCLSCSRAQSYLKRRPHMKDKFKPIADSYYLKLKEQA